MASKRSPATPGLRPEDRPSRRRSQNIMRGPHARATARLGDEKVAATRVCHEHYGWGGTAEADRLSRHLPISLPQARRRGRDG